MKQLLQYSALMVQGTSSDAGKSAVVTGLCRYFLRQGVAVAPFKPQNMALNSAVTDDGGEIGRSQAVQAEACGLPAHTDMNPVLLKPNSGDSAQVIIHGKVAATQSASQYSDYKRLAREAVVQSYRRLQQQYQLLIIEGAGSPAEINLRDGDIANMGFAELVNCPVILIADIDKGGVFAHIVGTLELLSASERQRILGFVINRFRGDIAFLQPGLDWLQQKTGKPVFAVLPFLPDLFLQAEDMLTTDRLKDNSDKPFKIIVPALPCMSNHTDFDALILHKQTSVEFIHDPNQVQAADLVILPGSKSVRSDLAWVREKGWDTFIYRHLRYRGKLFGICGGYQMLGAEINDPLGIEGTAGSSKGLNLLDIETTLQAEKRLRRVNGFFYEQKIPVQGYEIHQGKTTGAALSRPLLQIDGVNDGAVADDGLVMGCYVHGLFDLPEALSHMLEWAGLHGEAGVDYAQIREQGINQLADALENHFDFKLLQKQYLKFADGQSEYLKAFV